MIDVILNFAPSVIIVFLNNLSLLQWFKKYAKKLIVFVSQKLTPINPEKSI